MKKVRLCCWSNRRTISSSFKPLRPKSTPICLAASRHPWSSRRCPSRTIKPELVRTRIQAPCTEQNDRESLARQSNCFRDGVRGHVAATLLCDHLPSDACGHLLQDVGHQ